jgi:hypothetical protein
MATGWPDYPALMATNGDTDSGLASDIGHIPPSLPPTIVGKRLRIETGASARRQMVKIFREMRDGTLDINKGSKLIYALTEISRALERETVERLSERLDTVERRK